MGWLSRNELHDLYLSGRFRKAATMIFTEIGGAPGYGVEAVIAGVDGHTIGECGPHELEELLAFGEEDKKTMGSPNPNLEVVRWAFNEIQDTSKRVAENAKRLEEITTARIIRFPTPLRAVGSSQQSQPN